MADQIVGVGIDPTDNDKLVLTFLDNTGTPSRYEADLTAWAGTPANLVDPSGVPSSGITVDAGGQIDATGDGVTTPLLLTLKPAVSLSDLAAPSADLTIGHRLSSVSNASAGSDAPNWTQVQGLAGRIVASEATVAAFPSAVANAGHYAILTTIDGADVIGLYEAATGTWNLRMAAGTGSSSGPLSGDTASRPTLVAGDTGTEYFDTDLVHPIWWTGAAWVDSNGATA